MVVHLKLLTSVLQDIDIFFATSNTTDRSWTRRDLGEGVYQITKVGAKCEYCSKKLGLPVYRSVRVEYQQFVDKNGKERNEFSWINSKCSECLTFILYKNGHVVINTTDEYAKEIRLYDDLKKYPSRIKLTIKHAEKNGENDGKTAL